MLLHGYNRIHLPSKAIITGYGDDISLVGSEVDI